MSLKPIVAAICFSLALFLLLFMVWPEYQHLQDLNKQMGQTKTRLEQSKDYVNRLENLSDRLGKEQKSMNKVRSALPSSPGVPSLLNFLDETGQNHGVVIKSIGSLTQAPHKGDIKKLSIGLNVVGSYSSFKNFIKAVESSSRIVDFQKVNFSMPERGEEEKNLPEFNLKLSTYFYAPQ